MLWHIKVLHNGMKDPSIYRICDYNSASHWDPLLWMTCPRTVAERKTHTHSHTRGYLKEVISERSVPPPPSICCALQRFQHIWLFLFCVNLFAASLFVLRRHFLPIKALRKRAESLSVWIIETAVDSRGGEEKKKHVKSLLWVFFFFFWLSNN